MMRSLLYVPVVEERFLRRAHERGADAIVLDLEDSIIESEKESARSRLETAVALVGRTRTPVFVRINSDYERQIDDATAACRAGAFGLVVSKVESADDIIRLARHLERVEADIGRHAPVKLIASIDTISAIFEARSIAKAHERVIGLKAGAEDIATALDAAPTPTLLQFPKLTVHFAAKANGLLSFGLMRSVSNYRDLDDITEAAREARAMGFDGATCIHPDVVAILNDAFSPSDEELRRARDIVAAAEAARRGAFVHEGRMIDAPIIARARSLLTRFDRRADM